MNAPDTKSFNIFHFAVAHLNLGMTHSSLGQKEKALAILKGIENIDDDGLKDPKTHLRTQVTALHNCGRLLLELGRPLEAVTVLRKAENRAKAVNYQAQGILNVLGESFQALNKTSEAEISFKKALEANHIPAYLNYGKFLAKNVSSILDFGNRKDKTGTRGKSRPTYLKYLAKYVASSITELAGGGIILTNSHVCVLFARS